MSIYLFREGKGKAERERVPSRLCAVCTDSNVGLDLMNYEIMT